MCTDSLGRDLGGHNGNNLLLFYNVWDLSLEDSKAEGWKNQEVPDDSEMEGREGGRKDGREGGRKRKKKKIERDQDHPGLK